MKYRRFEGETDQQLTYRICGEKDQIGTWDDVADILNELMGTHYTESKFRKSYKAFMDTLTDQELPAAKVLEGQNEDVDQLTELKKERIKIQTEKVELNKMLRETSRDELLIEKIHDAITKLPRMEKPEYIESAHNDKAYLLTIADCHFAIEFQVKDLFGNVINEYSPEIFKKRMFLLFNNVLETIEKEGIKELTVWSLGDEINGCLRLNSQLMQMRYGVVESAILFAEYMANWLNALSEHVRINYSMVFDSNHNQLRLCGAPKNAFPDENMSRVINAFLKERLKDNPNIIIEDNPTGMNFDCLAGYWVLGIHGEVKNMARGIDEFSRMYGERIDYLIGGHVHHAETKEVGMDSEVISVKSVIGVDPYGASLRRTSNAGANLFVFEVGKGKVCEYTYKLN